MTDRMFTITFETETVLSVSDLWPDGFHPTNPTVNDVVGLVDAEGGPNRVLHDWGLGPLRVTVTTWPPVDRGD